MISLTATELPRVIACNGSRLLGKLPEFEPDDTARKEGNTVHWLIEQVFSGQFTSSELIDRKSPDGVYITPEMVERIKTYLSEIKGFIEYDTSFEGFGYIIKGRADNISFQDGILTVSDFKYGWRLVEVEENWTLIAHAIGFLLPYVQSEEINVLNDIKRIDFKIYQPRPYHPNGEVRIWSINAQQLLDYHNKLNAIMSNLTDVCSTGDHCKGCGSFAICPSAVKASMNSIDVSEKVFDFEIADEKLPPLLDDLHKAKKMIETSIKAYEDVACHRIKSGRVIEGYALEQGMSNRQWNEGITPEIIEIITGRNDLVEKKLVSPAQAEKKGLDEELVKSLTDRKKTSLKLCKINPTKKVEKIFGEFLKQKER